jgi:hypothetical protein
MRQRFIRKYILKPEKKAKLVTVPVEEPKKAPKKPVSNNKKSKKEEAMNIDQIEQLASELTAEQTTKRIKKDKGLIERTESSKVLITEDNKQLLVD